MARSRSRSRSRERRQPRGSSRDRHRQRSRSRSRERRRDHRRHSPDGRREPDGSRERQRSRERPSGDGRGSRPDTERHERRQRGDSRERGGSRERRREDSGERRRTGSRERDQRAMPPPPPRAPGPCFRCGEEGHMARDCPNAPAGGGGGKGPCYKCGEEGHIARDCPNPDAGGGMGGRGRRRGGEGDDSNMAWGRPGEQQEEELPDKEVEPEFGLSGALAAETNKVNGVVLVHQEPGEARKPTARWRLYIFKNGEQLPDPLYIHRASCFLFGRERKVADIPTDHPSCSKQHAVLQFRLTEKEGEDGMMKAAVRPYLMDLGSTNGTFLNNERLEPERYYELLEGDLVKFGNSSREYVLLKEK